ncbi:MAG: alpha-galactosidase [Planctomycetaceae bacterium]|nr:alpha-galactosidase [Planctomycetaceae bacterium]
MKTSGVYGISLIIMWLPVFGYSAIAQQPLRIENDSAAVMLRIDKQAADIKFKQVSLFKETSITFSEKPASAEVRPIDDPLWGKGQTLDIQCASGSSYTMTLYPEQPFIFLQMKLKNASSQTAIHKNIVPFKLRAAGRSVQSLKALGTGGLTGVAKKSNSGSYAFLAIADPNTREGIVAAWLTNELGSGVLFSDVLGQAVVMDPRIDFGSLRIGGGQSQALETFILGGFTDARLGLEAYAAAVAKKYAVKLKPQPVVYCTWYHAGASNEKDLAKNAAFAQQNLAPFGFSVVQIDDKWQDGVRSNGPQKVFERIKPDGPYPAGMKATADRIKSLGLTPGIWFMPFAGTFDDPYFSDKQYLFATKDGQPFDTKWGGTCFDLTNPKTQQYVYDTAHRIAHEWGYQYFKMDGLFTGTAARLMYVNDRYKDDQFGETTLHDPNMTHIQAYRTGLGIVRKAAGPEVFFLGCCIQQNIRCFAPAMGLVDAMRIGPDNNRMWEAMLRGPDYGSRSYFLNRRVWYNDPDPIYVQEDVPLEQARSLCSWVTIAGQLSASSVDYTKLTPERFDILKRTMPSHTLTPRPADLFEQKIPRIWLLTDESSGTQRDVIALYNWDGKQAAKISYPLEKLGLDGKQQYVGFDYWTNTFVKPFSGRIVAELAPTACKILSVRPVSESPQVLGTSRHITQGIMDIKKENWNAVSKTLEGTSELVGGDPYEIRLAAFKKDGPWKFKAAAVSGVDGQTPAATIRLISQEGPYIRVLIESPQSLSINWKVQFE